MNYTLSYSGAQVDQAINWVLNHRSIRMDIIQSSGETTEMSVATAQEYDLILIHGYVANSGCPNQGMLIFDPSLIQARDANGHGCFSSTVWRGQPGAPENGAPIAIEVMLKQGDQSKITWIPCYAAYYGPGVFYAQKILGLKATSGTNL